MKIKEELRLEHPYLYKSTRKLYYFPRTVVKACRNLAWIRSPRVNRIVKSHLIKVSHRSSPHNRNMSNRLVLICMSRDENSLLEQWLAHHSRIEGVKAIVLIDHLSVMPLSIPVASQNEQLDFHLYRFINENYFQAHVLNAVARDLLCTYPNDIFMPLDTDEFLISKYIYKVIKHTESFGYLDWRMAWPFDLIDKPVNSSKKLSEMEFDLAPKDYLGNKHFMDASLLNKSYFWSQGAHELYNRFGMLKKGAKVGTMIHVPVRDYNQIFEKFNRGATVHLDKSLRLSDENGEMLFANHWNISDSMQFNATEMIRSSLKKYLPVDFEFNKNVRLQWDEVFDV